MTHHQIPKLSQNIVDNRQEKAPLLKTIINTCHDFRVRLEDVTLALGQLRELDTPDIQKSRKEMADLLDELDVLRERATLRHNRFKSGMVTVSIAGLEKAGKTTFLQSLTGIGSLPAFDERCTAVCCEIHYSQDRSDFDIEFHTESEFMDRVLRPAIETVGTALPDEFRSCFVPPSSASEFINLRIPNPETVPGGTTAFKLLRDLQQIQEHFHECRQVLGKAPVWRRPLGELSEWVSHRPAGPDADMDDEKARARHLARVTAAKVCRIHTDFRGGSPHLRWIDTPGVDDPNRRARDLTLATIASDTDLLVVASRPGSNPSPNENFHHFWDSVSRQPDEIDLLNRLLFVLNCDRRVDPEEENIRIHRKYLVDAGVPQHLFVGPFEAIRESDAAALMSRVNEHLMNHLPDQDDRVIQAFQARVKNVQARIRLLHDTLANSHPSDTGQQDMEYEEFNQWFHWYHGDQDAGFWTELVKALDRSARSIAEDDRILESENALNKIFAEQAKEIQEKIPSSEDLDEYLIKHRGENPIPNGMRTLMTHFSRLVNHLSDEIQEFGPIMQDELTDVLTKSGLESLLVGKTSAEKLRHLLENFQGRGRPMSSKNSVSVLEVLNETLELPRNIKYVLRYELRGAVDFCDPTLWNEKEQAWKRLTDMVMANSGKTERLAVFDTHKHPPVTETREKDHEILKKIAGNAMIGIHAVLNNERYLPRRIADDFMRDCRARFCFSPESEQEWRTLLFPSRGILLARAIGQIRARSERIQAFRQAIHQLEADLP